MVVRCLMALCQLVALLKQQLKAPLWQPTGMWRQVQVALVYTLIRTPPMLPPTPVMAMATVVLLLARMLVLAWLGQTG